MEIIARRKDSLLLLFGVITLFGVIATVVSLQGFWDDKFAIGGIIIVVAGVILCARILRTPKEIIRYDGEFLILREGKYKIDQLSKINYRCMHIRGRYYHSGTLTLLLNGKEIVYDFVADVEEVHNRLMALRLKVNAEK